MIRQAASAISTALLDDQMNLQSVRLPLSEAMYREAEEGFVADRAIGWSGGPQETYRTLGPIVRQLMQSVQTLPTFASGDGNLLPRITEQVLLDFDGSALLTAESPAGPLGDAQALVQPNTDKYYRNIMKSIQEQLPAKRHTKKSDKSNEADIKSNGDDTETEIVNRLFLLVNPGWRDANSFGIFNAQQAQKEIFDCYPATDAMDQFVVRGQKCSLLKVWPHDWCIFWSKMPYEQKKESDKNRDVEPEFLGSFSERPTYQVMDQLLQQALQQQKEKNMQQ